MVTDEERSLQVIFLAVLQYQLFSRTSIHRFHIHFSRTYSIHHNIRHTTILHKYGVMFERICVFKFINLNIRVKEITLLLSTLTKMESLLKFALNMLNLYLVFHSFKCLANIEEQVPPNNYKYQPTSFFTDFLCSVC